MITTLPIFQKCKNILCTFFLKKDSHCVGMIFLKNASHLNIFFLQKKCPSKWSCPIFYLCANTKERVSACQFNWSAVVFSSKCSKIWQKICNLGKLIRKKEKFPNTLTIFAFFSILCDSGANQVYAVIFKTFFPTQ